LSRPEKPKNRKDSFSHDEREGESRKKTQEREEEEKGCKMRGIGRKIHFLTEKPGVSCFSGCR